MRYLNIQALSAADTSTGLLAGSPVPEQGVLYASVQATFDTTVAGTLELQFSNDPAGQTPANWSNAATATVTAGSSSAFIPATLVCANFLRVAFNVTTAGTSKVTARLQGYSA